MQPPKEQLAHVTEAGLQIAARSGRGQREHNEDSLSIIPVGAGVLLAVADGLGGHHGGEIASSAFCDALTALAAEHLAGAPDEVALSRLYEAAAAHLQQVITQSDAETARTTCALVWVHPQRIVALTVGDTRIYILREGEIGSWRSRDHSIAELALYDITQESTAAISEADRARLYKSLGLRSVPEPALASHEPLRAGDSVVVCSDGVWGCVAIDDLIDVGASADLQAAVDAVVERAVAFAGIDADNATLIVARPQPVAVQSGCLSRAPGLLRGTLVTLPTTGTLTVMGVLRATPDSVTYLMQDDEQQVHWLKEFDAGLQAAEMSEAYRAGAPRPPAVLCPPLDRAGTERLELMMLGPVSGTPLGWPRNVPTEPPKDFPRNAFLALADCHREGIFHGALRPRNITWRPNGSVVFLEALLRKGTASAQQDIVDLLHVCCAVEKPGSARRAKMQALTRVDKLTAADVVAELDGRSGADGIIPSWLRRSFPAAAIAAGVIIAWSAMRPYGQIEPGTSPGSTPQQASASAGQQAAVTLAVLAQGNAAGDAVVQLQIMAEDGKALPANAVRVWVNDLAIDANKAFNLQRRSYHLVVEASGYQRYERVLDASRGGHMEVPVQLRKIPLAAQEPKAAPFVASKKGCAAPQECQPPGGLADSGPASAAAGAVSGNVPLPADAQSPCPGSAPSCLNLTPPPCVAAGDCTHRSAASGPARPESAPPAPKSRSAAPTLDHDTGPPGR